MNTMTRTFNRVKRSLAKSLTFRILIVASDFVVIYLITRQFAVTLAVIVSTNVIGTIIYFIHEMIWKKTDWVKF